MEKVVVHVAWPLELSATAPQPLMVVPSEVKSTVPLVTGDAGAPLVTVAVKVTDWLGLLAKDGLRLLDKLVLVRASDPVVMSGSSRR